MDDHETWPPIRGTGWVNVGRHGVRQVQRRTGDVGVDSQIHDLIEDAATSPNKTSECMRRAWELYDAHRSPGQRIARGARALMESALYLVLWLAIGAVLVTISTHIWR